ncbi:hypothetical protein SDJN02_14106, partial [Cucurbita argyrosperma subsp. argyrosperma]
IRISKTPIGSQWLVAGFCNLEITRAMKKATTGSIVLLLALLSLQDFVRFALALPPSESNQDEEQSATTRPLEQDKEHFEEVHCSRERSRTAWNILEEHLLPFVEKENYQVSTKCRLHPNNDLYRDQEQHKIHFDINHWQCGYCRKSFRAEKFLDKHFDNRHYDLLNVSHGKCLADLCGALHCDLKMDIKSRKSKCKPAAAARNKHLCESLADTCFPINEGPSASRLHELFLHQFCGAHSCTEKQKPFSRGAERQPGIFYMASSILILMLLPIFYVIVYLHRRESRNGIEVLRRITKSGRKSKPL